MRDLGERTLVMGVLNATPDSFSHDGFGDEVEALARQGTRMVEEGADLLDVGGASSRPGHDAVPVELELRRALTAVSALRERVGVPLSIDSTEPDVVAACLEAGARIVNDVSGLRDERLAVLAAARTAWLVIVHSTPSPRSREERDADPSAIVGEVIRELAAACDRAARAGLPRERIIVDPGLGFAKTAAESFVLLRELAALRALGPVLVGPSRKGHLGVATGRPVGERLFATAAAVACAVRTGADLVRVHDVAPMVDVVRTADAIRRGVRVTRVAFIGLGANLGQRRETLRRAVAALGSVGRVRAVSGLWETAPLHLADQPAFLNAVVAVEVVDDPPATLVGRLKAIERDLGRSTGERFGPRAVDLDLLLFAGADAVARDGDVVVPHERLAERRFVLAPLAELAPEETDPRSGRRVRQLLADLQGQDATRVEGDAWWKTGSS